MRRDKNPPPVKLLMVSLEIFGRRDFLSFYTCGEVCARGLGRSVIAWPTLAINGNHFGERPSPGPPLGHPLSTRESFKTITDRPAASFIREFAIQFRQLPRLPFAFNYSGTYARGTFITVICRLVSRTRRFCAIDGQCRGHGIARWKLTVRYQENSVKGG